MSNAEQERLELEQAREALAAARELLLWGHSGNTYLRSPSEHMAVLAQINAAIGKPFSSDGSENHE